MPPAAFAHYAPRATLFLGWNVALYLNDFWNTRVSTCTVTVRFTATALVTLLLSVAWASTDTGYAFALPSTRFPAPTTPLLCSLAGLPFSFATAVPLQRLPLSHCMRLRFRAVTRSACTALAWVHYATPRIRPCDLWMRFSDRFTTVARTWIISAATLRSHFPPTRLRSRLPLPFHYRFAFNSVRWRFLGAFGLDTRHHGYRSRGRSVPLRSFYARLRLRYAFLYRFHPFCLVCAAHLVRFLFVRTNAVTVLSKQVSAWTFCLLRVPAIRCLHHWFLLRAYRRLPDFLENSFVYHHGFSTPPTHKHNNVLHFTTVAPVFRLLLRQERTLLLFYRILPSGYLRSRITERFGFSSRTWLLIFLPRLPHVGCWARYYVDAVGCLPFSAVENATCPTATSPLGLDCLPHHFGYLHIDFLRSAHRSTM